MKNKFKIISLSFISLVIMTGPFIAHGLDVISIEIISPCTSPLTDARDSKSYVINTIGNKCWMRENLNVGTMVVGTSTQTDNSVTEKYCYGDSEASCTTNGGLYQWSEVMNYSAGCNGTGMSTPACATPVTGICPANWHIPSHDEWTALERAVCTSGSCVTNFPYDTTTTGIFLGTDEGLTLQSMAGSFRAVLGGDRDTDGVFANTSLTTGFWSSTDSEASAWGRFLNINMLGVLRVATDKANGYSVRCVKDVSTMPTISAILPSNISTSTVILYGNITGNGGDTYLTRGFNYGTTAAYGLSTSTTGFKLADNPARLPRSR